MGRWVEKTDGVFREQGLCRAPDCRADLALVQNLRGEILKAEGPRRRSGRGEWRTEVRECINSAWEFIPVLCGGTLGSKSGHSNKHFRTPWERVERDATSAMWRNENLNKSIVIGMRGICVGKDSIAEGWEEEGSTP